MNALMKKAVKDVTRRKLRSLLTILGIIISIMGLSAINIASDQIKSSIQYSVDASAQPDIQIFTAQTNSSIVSILQQQPNVKYLQATQYQSTRWTIPTGHFAFTIVGIKDFSHVQINKFELVEGRLPGPGEILLESSDKSINALQVGQDITIEVRGAPVQVKVSGFVRTQGYPSPIIAGNALSYMHETDLETLFHSSGVNTFLFRLAHYDQRDDTAKQLTQVLETNHVSVLGVSVGHSDVVPAIIEGIFSVMRVLSIIALLLSVFLMLTTVSALIGEQIPTIGTMKALGAKRRQIIFNYLTSVAIYGVVGTIIGIGLGVLCGFLLVNYMGTLLNLEVGQLNVTLSSVVVSGATGIVVPLLAALLPIYFGTRISVNQALTGYGLLSGATGRGSRNSAQRAKNPFSLIPSTMRMGIKSLFRKRTRALLTLLALALSGTVFLSVQTTAYSFGTLLDNLFSTYHFDAQVSLSRPVAYSTLQSALSAVSGIERIEETVVDSVHTDWGTGFVTGIQPDAQLYRKQIVDGRWFTNDDQGVVVISIITAQKSRLKVGDTISFHDDLHSTTWRIIGIARDYNNLGGAPAGVLLAPVAQVKVFVHLPLDFTQNIMIRSSSGKASDIDALAVHIDDALSTANLQASVVTSRQLIQANQSEFLILYVLLYSVVVIVALVGTVGLSNALAMNVLERRREIGILRSIGATGRNVALVFWTEGASLGVVAWVIALALGIPASYGFVLLLGHLLVQVPFVFSPLSPIFMLGFMLLIASLASVGPVWGAACMKIAQTLRYE